MNLTLAPTLNQYLIKKELGGGVSARVYLGVHMKSLEVHALKVYKTSYLSSIEAETQIHSHLKKHPCIINLESWEKSAPFTLPNDKKYNVGYSCFEYAINGDLWNVVTAKSGFSEPTARRLFQQLISALKYCHSQGVAHMDVKLENLLLDENYNLKLADFGLATNFIPNQKYFEMKGTREYCPPEILTSKGYFPEQVDCFLAGVTLFSMVTGKTPFREARDTDPCFRYLNSKNPIESNKYWAAQENQRQKDQKPPLSEELKDLITKLLCKNPDERLTIPGIEGHPWFKMAASSLDEAKKELE